MSDKPLEEMLIGKVRHNLKTHLNIICGFSELIIEDLEDSGQISRELDESASALAQINGFGSSITSSIEKFFDKESFSAGKIKHLLKQQSLGLSGDIEAKLSGIETLTKTLRVDASPSVLKIIDEDLSRIENARRLLKENVNSLVHEDIESASDLVKVGLISESDLEGLNTYNLFLRDDLEPSATKYPSRILVVDDNPSNLEFLKRKLAAVGHQSFLAESGDEAEEILAGGEEIDLILLDILMPGVSGYEILSRNIEALKKRNIPVLMVSSLGEQETVYRCLEKGAEDFVSKPINFVILSSRINSALERKHLLDREEKHLRAMEDEKERYEKLLLNILPQPIAMRMKADEYLIADDVDSCSILFADIVGFTGLAQKMGASQIVALLNKLFSHFDEECEILGLEKIKTIGDNYMAAAGVPKANPDHASLALEMGLRMLEYVKSLDPIMGADLAMRIGVHSGSAVAGVIGKKKFVYDLWGDAVNTAQRMESHGFANEVHISDATARLVTGKYQVSSQGLREIKGKGLMETFVASRLS
ncbi:MAG: adenylate/guanylate cyclase domain-containing protein [Pseudomonadota bacterium]|nr:adenylate/guanylate cyclase domain-containing protein [Pseudomonadota bacterium]